VYEDSTSLPSLFVVDGRFETTRAGTLEAVVDWTFPDSPVGVYLVRGDRCDLAAFNARRCDFVARSENGNKPRRVSGAAGVGAFHLLVANFSPRQESATAQVFLATGTCSATGTVNASGVPAADIANAERMVAW
jgi:hypothetical protein